MGSAWCRRDARFFPTLTVEENLVATRRGTGWTLERVYHLFPRLRERRPQHGAAALGRRAADAGDRPRPCSPTRACSCSTRPPRASPPKLRDEIWTCLARHQGVRGGHPRDRQECRRPGPPRRPPCRDRKGPRRLDRHDRRPPRHPRHQGTVPPCPDLVMPIGVTPANTGLDGIAWVHPRPDLRAQAAQRELALLAWHLPARHLRAAAHPSAPGTSSSTCCPGRLDVPARRPTQPGRTRRPRPPAAGHPARACSTRARST